MILIIRDGVSKRVRDMMNRDLMGPDRQGIVSNSTSAVISRSGVTAIGIVL